MIFGKVIPLLNIYTSFSLVIDRADTLIKGMVHIWMLLYLIFGRRLAIPTGFVVFLHHPKIIIASTLKEVGTVFSHALCLMIVE